MMKKAGSLMIAGSVLLFGLFVFPLWFINLVAPQYPEHLGMYIYINDIQGATRYDILNIDGLNHYIGMKTIPKPEEMWEFAVFPKVVLFMGSLGVLLGILGMAGKTGPKMFLFWFIAMSVLGILGIYDFNLWLIDYGTNLNPEASIQLLDDFGNPMTYKPPLIGHKKLLNFDVDSWPRLGGYLLGASIILSFAAYWTGNNSLKKIRKIEG